MCYDAFHSVHNSNSSNSSKSQAYLALTEQEQSEPVNKEQSRITRPRRHAREWDEDEWGYSEQQDSEHIQKSDWPMVQTTRGGYT